MNDLPSLQKECWDQALYAFGTSEIFSLRMKRFGHRLRCLSFLGIVSPAVVGATLVAYGTNSWALSILIWLAPPVCIALLVTSVWSLVAQWQYHFAYASESLSANQGLYDKYRRLAKSPPNDLGKAMAQFDLIEMEKTCRRDLDNKKTIKPWELRMGHRAALRQMRRACVACKETPTSMKPSQCDVCGDFRIPRI